MMSLRRLGVERIDLWQLHRIDSQVDYDAQFGVIADMQREGLIHHIGLSEVVADGRSIADAPFVHGSGNACVVPFFGGARYIPVAFFCLGEDKAHFGITHQDHRRVGGQNVV